MKAFNYHQTTKIVFGTGKINELPEIAKEFGRKILMEMRAFLRNRQYTYILPRNSDIFTYY